MRCGASGHNPGGFGTSGWVANRSNVAPLVSQLQIKKNKRGNSENPTMNESDRADLYSSLMAENSLAVQELMSSSALAVQELIPLLELDREHQKGKYLGTLFCASAIDADGTLFPLAFTIVDVESDKNWMWFLSELRKLLGVNTDKMPVLMVLSEGRNAIVEAVESRFPSCLRYISESFRDEFENTKLVNLVWNAVYSLTNTEFEARVVEMLEIQNVMPCFHQFPPNLWAVAYFEGVRYGHFTLGITEVFCNWALEGHELLIVQMMEHIHTHLTLWFVERQALGSSWPSILVPSAEKIILEAVADSHCYQILRANKVTFEIVLWLLRNFGAGHLNSYSQRCDNSCNNAEPRNNEQPMREHLLAPLEEQLALEIACKHLIVIVDDGLGYPVQANYVFEEVMHHINRCSKVADEESLTLRSPRRLSSHASSDTTDVIERYSALVEDQTTTDCFLLR
ncbi:hypothetical protein KSP39_PZI006520 [Platanthera zijinensis]|uniref:MULE transposase domain-containing protein n=1 Tax=Platanthera zijinensis TaxID=2320716 RepID=A0AAP0BPI4_9ASPA